MALTIVDLRCLVTQTQTRLRVLMVSRGRFGSSPTQMQVMDTLELLGVISQTVGSWSLTKRKQAIKILRCMANQAPSQWGQLHKASGITFASVRTATARSQDTSTASSSAQNHTRLSTRRGQSLLRVTLSPQLTRLVRCLKESSQKYELTTER